MSDARQQLLDDLEARSDEAFSSGRFNNFWHISLSISIIGASLVATVLTAGNIPKLVLATAAALPAALATAQRTFQPRKLAQWYFEKSTRLGALWTELAFDQTTDVAAIGKRLSQLEIEMESRWKDIGEDTAPPTLTRQRSQRMAARTARRP